MSRRIGEGERVTKETRIKYILNLDGEGKAEVKTGIPFLDHMLTLFAKHGLFDLKVEAQGDLEVDVHHTNEDVGICLGEGLKKALEEKRGIRRFGHSYIPMDEALALVVVDLSGRPYLHMSERNLPSETHLPPYNDDKYRYSFQDARQFFQAFVSASGTNMHIYVLAGENFHHVLEAIFKAFACALAEATARDKRVKGIPSTKGRL